MPQIVQANSINPTALQVPDLYVIETPPAPVLNGVASNILGIVGTASWGPVNSPVTAGSPAEATQIFGPMQARKYDLGTALYAAALQGASAFALVRVTDGTDTAASGSITCANSTLAAALASAINSGISGLRGPSQMVVASVSGATLTITAKYTGSAGNNIVVSIGPGSAATSTSISFNLAQLGLVPETFNNVGVTAQSASSVTLSGGTDGTTTITSTVLVGVDTIPRKGMYALRNSGASVGMLADADDTTQWTLQAAFALSAGIYMIGVTPAGDTISNAATELSTAGIDCFGFKVMFGDWCYITDPVNNGILRLISPQGFAAGILANLSPQNSSLNKQLNGIVGTQKTMQSQVYSNADLQALVAARLDVITNPAPGGAYFAARIGHNTSSNPAIYGDNYTRMTNYIAQTIARGMGIFVGETMTADEFKDAKATLDNFFFTLYDEEMIGNTQGTIPWSVQLDANNNPQQLTALGIQTANCLVEYLSINEKFLINLQGGQTVVIPSRSLTQQ